MADDQQFDIGLVMAGAVSAGAYSAGVVDFLIEALDEWDKARAAPGYSGPAHRVRIAAMSGASAGAMTAAIAAIALNSEFEPVADVNQPPAGERNRLFDGWVRMADITRMLTRHDLEGGRKLVSALDSSALAEIASSALDVRPLAGARRHVADPLPLFLTVANLRGVPYGIRVEGENRDYRHGMSAHADHMAFAVTRQGRGLPGALTLELANLAEGARQAKAGGGSSPWLVLRDSALASGAFPIGLAPRLLTRPIDDYAIRRWPVPVPEPAQPDRTLVEMRAIKPTWPANFAPQVDFWNVDGGLMNNEPLELARMALAGAEGRNPRPGDKATRAVLMIDPFPNETGVVAGPAGDIDLIGVITGMFNALKNQTRFKLDELALAESEDVYSRFVIAPSRRHADGTLARLAMASAIMGGFGGFLSEAFRRHDFQLGRRNCQRFLQEYLALPETNPLFGGTDPTRFRPVIALFGSALRPVPAPIFPAAAALDAGARKTLRKLVSERFSAVGDGVVNMFMGKVLGWALKSVLRLARAGLVEKIMTKIETELSRLDHDGEPARSPATGGGAHPEPGRG